MLQLSGFYCVGDGAPLGVGPLASLRCLCAATAGLQLNKCKVVQWSRCEASGRGLFGRLRAFLGSIW